MMLLSASRSACAFLKPALSQRTGYYGLNRLHSSISLTIPTPEDMEDLGALLSVGTTHGDVILMDGDLGAGKTCFSRGFVRARTGMEGLGVTSPTYLLCNTYPTTTDDDESIL